MGRIDRKTIAEKRNVTVDDATPWYEKFWNGVKALKTWQKVLILVILVLLLALGIAGKMAVNYVEEVVQQVHTEIPENYDLSLVPVDGYLNILALGVDSRDMTNIKGTRSDMIMIASINMETYDVKLTSVYRDTCTKIGDTPTYDKITHACAYGGPELTMKSLNQLLDIDLESYVVVNFKAVADLVDAVGGIEVDVQEKELNQLNKYTKQTAHNIGRKNYHLAKQAGLQTLEGVQAVSYGRIRKGVGDDIKRTERMRTVVSLTLDKLKQKSFGEIKEIIEMMLPQVQTNLDMNNILALGIKLPKYNITSGASYPYSWYAGMMGQMSYVFSRDYVGDTRRFHEEVFGQTGYVPSSTVSAIASGVADRKARAKAAEEASETDIASQFDPEFYDLDRPIYDSKGEIIGYELLETESSEGGGENQGTDPSNPGTNTDNPGTDPTQGEDNPGTDEPVVDPNQGETSTGDNPETTDPVVTEPPVEEAPETPPETLIDISAPDGDGSQVT